MSRAARLARLERAAVPPGANGGGVIRYDSLTETAGEAFARAVAAGWQGGALVLPEPLPADVWERMAREQQAQLVQGIFQ